MFTNLERIVFIAITSLFVFIGKGEPPHPMGPIDASPIAVKDCPSGADSK